MSRNNLPELKEIETLRGKMENKKPSINFKKNIAWIGLGFVIGSVLRYASTIFFEVPVKKWGFGDAAIGGTLALVVSCFLTAIMLLIWSLSNTFIIRVLFQLYEPITDDLKHPSIYFAIAIGTFTGYAIGFALTYDAISTSITDVGEIFIPFIGGIFSAIVLATVDAILAYTYIHKKRIINLVHAIVIGFTFGFYFGHILVFSILDLI